MKKQEAIVIIRVYCDGDFLSEKKEKRIVMTMKSGEHRISYLTGHKTSQYSEDGIPIFESSYWNCGRGDWQKWLKEKRELNKTLSNREWVKKHPFVAGYK